MSILEIRFASDGDRRSISGSDAPPSPIVHQAAERPRPPRRAVSGARAHDRLIGVVPTGEIVAVASGSRALEEVSAAYSADRDRCLGTQEAPTYDKTENLSRERGFLRSRPPHRPWTLSSTSVLSPRAQIRGGDEPVCPHPMMITSYFAGSCGFRAARGRTAASDLASARRRRCSPVTSSCTACPCDAGP